MEKRSLSGLFQVCIGLLLQFRWNGKEILSINYGPNYLYSYTCATVHVLLIFTVIFTDEIFKRLSNSELRNPHLNVTLKAVWQFVVYWRAEYVQQNTILEHAQHPQLHHSGYLLPFNDSVHLFLY